MYRTGQRTAAAATAAVLATRLTVYLAAAAAAAGSQITDKERSFLHLITRHATSERDGQGKADHLQLVLVTDRQ